MQSILKKSAGTLVWTQPMLMAAFWLHSPHGVRSTAFLTKAFRSAQSRSSSGKGNAGKQAVIAAVKALDHLPEDDNEADALALLHFAREQMMGGQS